MSSLTRSEPGRPLGGGERYRFAFVMDQQVGLRTQALNLQQIVGDDLSIEAHWVPVRYAADDHFLSRVPGIPKSVKGTLAGIREIRSGIQDAGRLEGVLWATWAAKSVLDLVARAPAFLRMDMTPLQMEAMGELYGYTRSRARFLGGWKRRATERLYQSAVHLFPWNEWVAESLSRDYGVPSEKVTAVSPGVDVTLYRPDPAARPDDDRARILFVGGDFQRKGGDMLLRWARETTVREPWEVQVVTRDEVPATPGVVVHRNLSNNSGDLIRLFQKCDLFVLPTRADCYSLAGLEAMACGLPLLITRLGGIPDLVEDGRTGFLLDVDDYEAFAQHLDWFVSNPEPRRTFGAAARRRACDLFDSRVTLGRILSSMKSAGSRDVPLAAA